MQRGAAEIVCFVHQCLHCLCVKRHFWCKIVNSIWTAYGEVIIDVSLMKSCYGVGQFIFTFSDLWNVSCRSVLVYWKLYNGCLPPYLATEAEVKHAWFGSVLNDEVEDVTVVFVSDGFARFSFDEGVHAVPWLLRCRQQQRSPSLTVLGVDLRSLKKKGPKC